MTEDEIEDSWKFAKPIEPTPTQPMKKLFQQIDDLCVGASIGGICNALHIAHVRFDMGCGTGVYLGGREYLLPDTTDRLWRRKWRKFLTDHVDDVAKNLDAVPAAARDAQSGSAV